MDMWDASALRALGPTGRSVIPIGMGTHGLGHAYGLSRGIDDLQACLNVFAASVPNGGGAIVDVAPRYGHGGVESWLGACELPPSLLLATKGGRHIDPGHDNEKDFSEEFLTLDLIGSLSRLGRGSIFLYQMHNPSEFEIREGVIFAVLERLRERGLIEWYGFSVDTQREAIAVLDTYERLGYNGLASIQLIHSCLTKLNSAELVDRAISSDVSLLAREVLCRGLLSPASLDFENRLASAVHKLASLYGPAQLLERRTQAQRIASSYGLSLVEAAIEYSVMTPGIQVTLVGVTTKHEAEEDLAPRGGLSRECYNELHNLPDLDPL